MKKILVTGSNGQLGSELKDLAKEFLQYSFLFFTREEFPINDAAIAGKIFSTHQPQYFINAAAYTAVDKAESEKELANDINGTAVGNLATLCREWNTKMIHVSTDYVFNGENSEPLKESDPVDPVNAYGESKLLGEQLAMNNNPEVMILRTAWVYSSHGKNFVKTMMHLMKERDSIRVVNDQWGSPTYAADLARTIMQIIDSGKWLPGIYHYSNEGRISWFDFAEEIRKETGAACEVQPIPTSEFPTPARRPKSSVLDKSKLQNAYALQPKHWKSSLKECLEKIKATSIS
jgi:dTDP-4-dehydrorhamnose reductase